MISKYLRSACHGAPVVQVYEQATDLFPIKCRACGQELGAPGIEDVPDAHVRIHLHHRIEQDMRMLRIRHMWMIGASAASPSRFIRLTGL